MNTKKPSNFITANLHGKEGNVSMVCYALGDMLTIVSGLIAGSSINPMRMATGILAISASIVSAVFIGKSDDSSEKEKGISLWKRIANPRKFPWETWAFLAITAETCRLVSGVFATKTEGHLRPGEMATSLIGIAGLLIAMIPQRSLAELRASASQKLAVFKAQNLSGIGVLKYKTSEVAQRVSDFVKERPTRTAASFFLACNVPYIMEAFLRKDWSTFASGCSFVIGNLFMWRANKNTQNIQATPQLQNKFSQ